MCVCVWVDDCGCSQVEKISSAGRSLCWTMTHKKRSPIWTLLHTGQPRVLPRAHSHAAYCSTNQTSENIMFSLVLFFFVFLYEEKWTLQFSPLFFPVGTLLTESGSRLDSGASSSLITASDNVIILSVGCSGADLTPGGQNNRPGKQPRDDWWLMSCLIRINWTHVLFYVVAPLPLITAGSVHIIIKIKKKSHETKNDSRNPAH